MLIIRCFIIIHVYRQTLCGNLIINYNLITVFRFYRYSVLRGNNSYSQTTMQDKKKTNLRKRSRQQVSFCGRYLAPAKERDQ